MAQQQLAPDIVRRFFELVYPHTRGRDNFKLSHGGRGGVSAVLELQELHPGDVLHSKAGRFAAADRDESCAIHAVSLQLLHHLETQGILPNDWWRWPPDWQLSQEPGVLRFTLICALLNMKEGYYTPRKNITTAYGISSSCYDLAETILDELIAEGSVTQNSMQQVRLASLEEFNRRQHQQHQVQQPTYAVQQPPHQPAYAVQQTPQQPAYAYQQPQQPTYVVSYADPEQAQQSVSGYTNALPVYTHQQQRVAYGYSTQTQQDYQQPQQPQVQQQTTAGAFDRRSAWQEARQAAVTAPASATHAVPTSTRATSSHAAAVGASGGTARASSSWEYRSTAPSAREQHESVHSSRHGSVAAEPAENPTQKRSSWVDERILQWQQQSQQPPPSAGMTAIKCGSNAAADHPFSMTSPRRLEQQRRRSSSQVPAFGREDGNGPSRVSTGQTGPPAKRHRHRSPSSPPRYAAAASPRRSNLEPYRHTQQLPKDRVARQSPQRRHSGSSSDHRSAHQQTLPPLEPRDSDRFDRREPTAHVDHRVDQRHVAAEDQQYKRPRTSLDLQQRQQLQPGRWMEDYAAAGAERPSSGAYSAGLTRDRDPEHWPTAHSRSSRGNSAVEQNGSASHHTRSGQQDIRGLADHVRSTDRHHLGRDLKTTGSPRSRGDPVTSPRFPRHTAAASPHHRDRSRSSSRHEQLPPSHKQPWHDRSAAGREPLERGGAALSAGPKGLGQRPNERVSLPSSHGSDPDRSAVRDKVAAAAAADEGRGASRDHANGRSSFRDKGSNGTGNKGTQSVRKTSRDRSEGNRKGSSNDKDRQRRSKSMDRSRDKVRRSKERELDNSRTLQNSGYDLNTSRERRDRESKEGSGRDRDRAKENPRGRSPKRDDNRVDRGRMERQQQQQRGKQTQQSQRDVANEQQQLTAGASRDSTVAVGQSAISPHSLVKAPDTTKLKTPQQLAAAVCQYMLAAAPFAVELSSFKANFAAASSSLSISGTCFDAFIARLAQEGLLEVFEGSDRHDKATQYVRALHSSWSEAVGEQIRLASASAAAAGNGMVDHSAGGQQRGPGSAATTVAAVAAGADHAADPASAVAVPDAPSDAAAAAAAAALANAGEAANHAEVSLTNIQQDTAARAAASKGPEDQHLPEAAAAAAPCLQDTAEAGPADLAATAAAAAAAEVPSAGGNGAGNPGIGIDARATAIITGHRAGVPAVEAVHLTTAQPMLQKIDHAANAGTVALEGAAGPTEVVAVCQAEMQDSNAGQAGQLQPAMSVADVEHCGQPAAAAVSAMPSSTLSGAAGREAAVTAGRAVADKLVVSAAAAAATKLADVASIRQADSSVAEAAAAAAAATDAALEAASAALAAGVPATAMGADCKPAGVDVGSLEARDAVASHIAVMDLAPAGMSDPVVAAQEPAGNGPAGTAPDEPTGVADAWDSAEEATPPAVAGKAAITAVLAATDADVAANLLDAAEHTEDDAAVLDLLPRAAAEEPATHVER